jgi:hypothetical protein
MKEVLVALTVSTTIMADCLDPPPRTPTDQQPRSL